MRVANGGLPGRGQGLRRALIAQQRAAGCFDSDAGVTGGRGATVLGAVAAAAATGAPGCGGGILAAFAFLFGGVSNMTSVRMMYFLPRLPLLVGVLLSAPCSSCSISPGSSSLADTSSVKDLLLTSRSDEEKLQRFLIFLQRALSEAGGDILPVIHHRSRLPIESISTS